jgi:hypothetical protein
MALALPLALAGLAYRHQLQDLQHQGAAAAAVLLLMAEPLALVAQAVAAQGGLAVRQ